MVGHNEGRAARAWFQLKQVQGKDHFNPISLLKPKENEFMHLQQESMSVLNYALKFMELSSFTPVFVADERLTTNWFGAGLNHTIKERMSVRQYISYMDQCGTAINIERAMKERSNRFNKQ